MILQKNFSTQLFADYYKTCQTGSHSIKLVVDDISFDVNKFILNCWSEEFGMRADDDHEIFLLEFNGYKEEIKLCVDLLHGQEIHVDINNINIILKFAAIFKVTDMLDAVMNWFKEQDRMSLPSFLNITRAVFNLHKIGYKFDQLFEIIRYYLEGNTQPCMEILADNFVEDVKFVIDILMYDQSSLEKCVSFFNLKTRQDDAYLYLLEKIETLGVEYKDWKNYDVIKELWDKAIKEVDNSTVLKQFMSLIKFPTFVKVVTFQSWRVFNKRELLYLQNNPDLKEYQYAVICLDWIQEHKPERNVVLEVYNSIKQEKLEYNFVYCIRYTLNTTLQYNNLPAVQLLPVYEYERQYWSISKQLLDCLNNNSAVQLSRDCFITNCTNKQTNHTVNLRLVNTSGKVRVQMLPVNTDNVHTHSSDRYVFWYLVGYTTMSTFYTNTYQEIVEFVKKERDVYIRCLYKL